ncbi:MAG: iron-containing alcohol dehydrogenase [Alloprevotella sp.]|nr:iron-containing alcohol dehydrogenase [Alloprevotella sp.]
MLGNFKYSNPTRLYFGDESMQFLLEELKAYGPTVLLTYGGGSIKRNGIYDQVVQILQQAGKRIVELSGVMPNPTVEKLREGAELARTSGADLILAVGGGSTIDYAKGVSVAAYFDGDAWETFYKQQQNPAADARILPVGAILTMVGTGSEMNGGSVITNHAEGLKIGKVFDERVMPRFSVLNPRFTFSLPKYQMTAGFFDIMSHLMEQYFSNDDDNTSDYLNEGLMRSLISSSLRAVENPEDYEARSNIMWTATWALNTLLKCAKTQDWMVHMIGQAIGAITDATHGMTLSAVSLPYYRYVSQFGLPKFARWAQTVWGVNGEGKTQEQIAREGIDALEAWMRQIGVVLHSAELGVSESNIEAIANGVILLPTGYHMLSREEVVQIIRQSM